jgi:hypothetical protein
MPYLLVSMTVTFAGNGDLETTSFAAVQRYSPADRLRSEDIAVPENVSAGPESRVLLETMLARSPSFRRQCLRIANERSLTVHLRHMPRLTGGTRAVTRMSRHPGGRTVAHVTVDPYSDDVEMIAHEFEHIIEQLDDVNLPEKAQRADSGVHATQHAGLAFETTRAARVGRRVVEEVRRGARQGS